MFGKITYNKDCGIEKYQNNDFETEKISSLAKMVIDKYSETQKIIINGEETEIPNYRYSPRPIVEGEKTIEDNSKDFFANIDDINDTEETIAIQKMSKEVMKCIVDEIDSQLYIFVVKKKTLFKHTRIVYVDNKVFVPKKDVEKIKQKHKELKKQYRGKKYIIDCIMLDYKEQENVK